MKNISKICGFLLMYIGFMCGMAYMVWLVNLNGFILDLPALLIIGVLIGLFRMIMVKLEV